jgi:hypothetical protein
MEMISKWKPCLVAIAAVLFVAPMTQAQSKWGMTGLGVAEYDTDGALFLLAGVSASPGGRGVSPILGVQGYHIGFDNGSDRTNIFAVKPYVGLSNNYGSGDIYGTVGYAFSNRDEGVRILTTSTNDVGSGVVVAGGWDHWGNGTPWGHQLLGSYNFDSENFWGRGRVTRQISASGPAQRRLGAEVAFSTGSDYTAWQPGAVLELHNGRGGILGLGAGLKLPDGGENAVYFKVEGVLPIAR